jgi:hypothetical protein
MIKFKGTDFLLKECEVEAKGTHSVDEMMRLVEVNGDDERRTVKLPPETIERTPNSFSKQ